MTPSDLMPEQKKRRSDAQKESWARRKAAVASAHQHEINTLAGISLASDYSRLQNRQIADQILLKTANEHAALVRLKLLRGYVPQDSKACLKFMPGEILYLPPEEAEVVLRLGIAGPP